MIKCLCLGNAGVLFYQHTTVILWASAFPKQERDKHKMAVLWCTMRAENWRARVYKMHIQSGMSEAEWKILRDEIVKRDKQRCYRCDKRFPKGKLSVHHIMPRADGGSNDPTNLISLCVPCHDYVETNNLKSKATIMGSLEMPGVEVVEMPDGHHKESFTRPDWHRIVYGAGRKRQQ